MTSIFIFDDQVVARHGLKHILKEEFWELRFGEASTVEEALATFNGQAWDVAILEAQPRVGDGLALLVELRDLQPDCRYIVLADRNSGGTAARALQLGASGFISKGASRRELVRAFSQVMAGRRYFSRDRGPKALPAVVVPPPAGKPTGPQRKLSPREQMVLAAVAAGMASGEIAAEMNVSVQTVSTFRKRIREKLGLRSTYDMVRYVMEHRPGPPPPRGGAKS